MTLGDAAMIVGLVLFVVAWIKLDAYASRWFWTTKASKHRFGLLGMLVDRLRSERPRP